MSNAHEVTMRTCTHHTDSERVAASGWENSQGCPVCAKSKGLADPAPLPSTQGRETGFFVKRGVIAAKIEGQKKLSELARRICHAVEQRTDDCDMEMHARVLAELKAWSYETKVLGSLAGQAEQLRSGVSCDCGGEYENHAAHFNEAMQDNIIHSSRMRIPGA